MPTSALDGSRRTVSLTGSMALVPNTPLQGSVHTPDAPGVLGTADAATTFAPTTLQELFSPAEPPVVLELAPPAPATSGVLGTPAADPMDEIAALEFQTDPDDEAVYVLLQEIHTADGMVYDVTMAQPAPPPPGVLGGGSNQGMRRCPVHRVLTEEEPPQRDERSGVLGGLGETIADLAGKIIFRRVLHVVRAPVNRALQSFIAQRETQPHAVMVQPDGSVGSPLNGFEPWRSRFQPGRSHRVLLFVHGFGSSTDGSLPRNWVQEIGASYDAVLGYDHPTVSQDPRQNARALLEQIPDDVRLDVDVIAHSRGGLVSRSLVELHQPLDQFNIQHLLTFGSPHAGTLLAHHERWDRLVSISLTALSWLTAATGAAAPFTFVPRVLEYLLQAAGQFIFDLPGIGAMGPDSDFLKELNAIGDTSLGERVRYAAITSTFDPLEVKQMSFRQALTAMAAQAFIGQPNDLVVPTESMQSIDLPTALPLAGRVFKTTTNHFTYFENAEVRHFASEFFRNGS